MGKAMKKTFLPTVKKKKKERKKERYELEKCKFLH